LHSGIAPSTVQQLSGHKDIRSVNNYATASIEMQHEMSNILCGVKSKDINHSRGICRESTCQDNATPDILPPVTAISTTSGSSATCFQSNEVNSSQSFAQFPGHSFNIAGNCTIQYINNYCVEPSQTRKRRRIAIFSDSSDST